MAEHVSKEKNFVSCVVYLHNEGSRVKGFLEEICKVMRMNFEKYEVVCVNDGCVDDTVEQVRAFLSGDECKPVVREAIWRWEISCLNLTNAIWIFRPI